MNVRPEGKKILGWKNKSDKVFKWNEFNTSDGEEPISDLNETTHKYTHN